MTSFPILKSQRLLLRELQPADSAAVFDLFGADDVTRFYDVATFTETEQAECWIDAMGTRFSEGQGIRWAITSHGSPSLIGTCGLVWRPHNFSAMLGYDLVPSCWGQGYATEAVDAIMTAAFDSVAPFRLNRVEALTYPENEASMAVLRKLGFSHEGLLRQWGYWKDSFHDLVCFSKLRGEPVATEQIAPPDRASLIE